MPTFNVSEYLDITVSEFLSECDENEIAEVIEILEHDGFISQQPIKGSDNFHQRDWIDICNKLSSFDVRMKMSSQEIDYVTQLVDKYSTQ